MMNVSSNPNTVITTAPEPIGQAINHSLCAKITNCTNSVDTCKTIACIGCGIGCCAVMGALGVAPSLVAAKTTTTSLALNSVGSSATTTTSFAINFSCGGCGGAKLGAIGAAGIAGAMHPKVNAAGGDMLETVRPVVKHITDAVVRVATNSVVAPFVDPFVQPIVECVIKPRVERVIERVAQRLSHNDELAIAEPKNVDIQKIKFQPTDESSDDELLIA